MSIKYQLGFIWEAKYDDGEIISQFDGEIDSCHFGHIWGPKSKRNPINLIEFKLISVNEPNKTYSVNIKDGVFNLVNEKINSIIDFAIPADQIEVNLKEVKLKLIYWRRVKQQLLGNEKTTLRHLFGYELSYRGNSLKKIVVIEPNGDWSWLSEKEIKTVIADGDFIAMQ